MSSYALPATALTRHTDPDSLPASTRRLPTPDIATLAYGQSRAASALTTAFDIKDKGYHVFAVGEPSLGKRTLIDALIRQQAKGEPTPPDLIYVHNFAQPRLPIAIHLPSGAAPAFATKLHKLYHTAKKRLGAKLTSERTQKRLDDVKSAVLTAQNQTFEALNALAIKDNFRLAIRTDGMAEFVPLTAPLDDKASGSGTTPTDAKPKPHLIKALLSAEKELDNLELSTQKQLDELLDALARSVIEPLISPLLSFYADNAPVCTHLKALQDDMIKHAERIVAEDSEFMPSIISDVPARYMVNVIATHKAGVGAPIVTAAIPTHLKLFGHCQYSTELGTVYSDVSMIRAGDLHHANGGYLIIDAAQLLEHPYAYQGLKSALKSRQIRLSELDEMLTMTGTVSLAPQAVSLSIKVILLGDHELYHELYEYDSEFAGIFGIKADFAHDNARTPASEQALVHKAADIIKSHNLPHFDRTALAALIDQMSRLTEHQDRLSLHAGRLKSLIFEAARHATQDGKKTVSRPHVTSAIAEQKHRSDYISELYWQDITSGHHLINTTGVKVGQINALTVLSHADSEFGLPTRLTAAIAPKFGSGDILDIERDVELGGSLHAKGMLIMTGFMRAQFSECSELNFSASIAFEQSYADIDGDSATLAECAVLLSALADTPIAQHIAITGSMNQLGDAQAVGGINEKIIGFYKACQHTGLTGTQGVIIPRSNVVNLSLPDEIISDVAGGRFHIYAIDSIFDALHLLTGGSVHDKNKNGDYKKTSLFGKIVARLASWEDDDKNDKKK